MPRELTRCAEAAAAEEETASLPEPYCSSDIACTRDNSDLGSGGAADGAEACQRRNYFPENSRNLSLLPVAARARS